MLYVLVLSWLPMGSINYLYFPEKSRMKKATCLALVLLATSGSAMAVDSGALIGGAAGAAAGAAIGNSANGQNGAILGAALGAAAGVALGSSDQPQPAPVQAARPAAHEEEVHYRQHEEDNDRHWKRREQDSED